MVGRLKRLDAHSALYLLRNSLWLPKLQYLLRAAPFSQHPALLKQLDEVIRAAMEELVNVRFSDMNWEQAVLPTGLGGLGLRRTEEVALPSFIASLHRCQQLLHTILPASFADKILNELKQAEEEWLVKAGGKMAPADDTRDRQKSWDAPIAEHQRDRLLLEANQFDRARILGAATPESGAWLRALPSSSLGTHLDNETVRIAVALRVGADVCSGVHACRCGSPADVKGHHALTCQFSAGRLPRHTALNDIVRRALSTAGIPAQLEPYGVDRGDGKRPDGMTIYPFSHGRCLVWDATCVNTFADSRLGGAALKSGAAAKKAEDEKRRKYAQLTQRFRFEPVAFETDGACGPTTRAFLQELGAKMAAVTGDQREMEWLWQRLSIAIVRGNAASVLLGCATDPSQQHLSAERPNRVSAEQQLATAAGSRRSGCSGGSRLVASQQRWSPPSPKKLEEESRALQLHGGKAHTARELQLTPAADPDKHGNDPLYTGLPNYGNSCYQNATMYVVSHRSLPGNPCEDGGGTGSQSDGRPLGLTGLRNTGNTCFLNTVVQCLSNTRALHDYILRDGRSSDASMPAAATKGSLMNTFCALIRDMWTSSDETERVLTTAPLKSMIQRLAPRFMGSQQQDAQEFLRYLLEGLHEDVNRVTSQPKPITTDIDDSMSASQKSMEAWKR
ncbi:Ubiquitin carboxyl-terminal hydrolase 2 [Amphibalanus amphitrite]|uniref:ubiquitinyl hydrolase 1 n=1 Tax=Amphibalanus amphitrite TaxID=1232801 RepID=A0A6A4VGW9_AMPAM|nr:Ubiquitin carboxyl-terminal hydrolase 2 [Amphibalanus amphitrite]